MARALRSGVLGRIESDKYRAWVKTLPCTACGAPADDPHHPYGVGYGGAATKCPDWWCIPLCRGHHDELHVSPTTWEAMHGAQLEHALLTLTRAIYEGVLLLEKP